MPLFILVLLIATVIIANREQTHSRLFKGLLTIFPFALIVFTFDTLQTVESIPLLQNIIIVIVGFGLSMLLMMLIQMPSMRANIKRSVFSSTDLNPDKPVHTLAQILALMGVGISAMLFIRIGGGSGLDSLLSEPMNSEGQIIASSLQDMLLFVMLSFLSVGLFMRRSLSQAMIRLKLESLSFENLSLGIRYGLLFYGGLIVASFTFNILFPDLMATSQDRSAAFMATLTTTIPVAIVVSLGAAIGEEILFRGALQPVFGRYITTALFAIVHLQYTLSIAWILVFGVGFGLAWLRDKYNTTVAIIAHFIFNFVQFVLLISLSQVNLS